MIDEKLIVILPEWLITSPLEPPKHLWGICVKGNQIVRVAPNIDLQRVYPDEYLWRAGNQVLAPGFVNTHTHMYGILAHGIPLQKPPSGFWSFLTDFWWPLVENRLDQDMICAATDLRCSHLLCSGVTTFYDCTEAPNALPGCLEAQSKVVDRHGLRAILSFEATERMGINNGEMGLRENLNFIKFCNEKRKKDERFLISGMMCHHTTFTCSAPFIQKAYAFARENNVLLHAHVSEGSYEHEFSMRNFSKRPIEYYDELGVAGPGFLASQCVQINADEIELISRRGVRVSHMPLSNCEVGGGIAPVPQLLRQNVTMGLGSDGYIDDFFEIMRGAFLIHKANQCDPGLMPANLVWYLATEGGAKTLGFEKIGKISEGWLADLQLIDASLSTPLEEHNLYEQLLLYRNSKDVNAVMVNGKVLVKNGNVIDKDWQRINARCQEEALRLWSGARK